MVEAAKIIAGYVRTNVSIGQGYEGEGGITRGWLTQRASLVGYERIYVASLRSVGIPARLNQVIGRRFGAGVCGEPRLDPQS